MHARQTALQVVALLLFLTVATISAQQDSQQDLGGSIGAAVQVSKLISDMLSSGDGKMIVSAAGDGSQCLDAGIWPSGCYDFTDPFCSSVGVWVWPTCTSSPWTYFQYDGKLSFSSGLRGLGRRLCVQAWACSDSSSSSSSSGSRRRLSGVVIDASGAEADDSSADATAAAGPAAIPAAAVAASQQLTTPADDAPALSAPVAAPAKAAGSEPLLVDVGKLPAQDAALAAVAPAAPAANTTQSGDAAELVTIPAAEQQSSPSGPLQAAPSCDARGAPCGWGGPHYMMFFSGDEDQRTKSGFPLFRIHFANKGDGWCLTNTQTDVSVGSQAQLRPCDGSLSQLWFIPQW